MEEKKKSNVGFIVIIIILFLIICGLVGYILYNHVKDDIKDQKGKTVETEVKKEEKVDSEYQDDLAELSKKIFQSDKENLSIDEFDEQELIYVLSNISGKSITEITGTELKKVAKENFGIDDLKLVDIRCGMNHRARETNVMLIFNPESDKYEYNDKHPGHGGGSSGIGYIFNNGKATVEGDVHKYEADIYFYKSCTGDTCGPTEHMDVYLTSKDLIEGINKVMDATGNEKCCKKLEVGYDCNFEEIYNVIKDKVHSIVFYYKIVDNKPVFERYEFK